MSKTKWIGSLLLAALLLAGCVGKTAEPTPPPVPETLPPAEETGGAPAEGGALRLSQDSTVPSPAYEGEEAFSAFLAAAVPRFLIPGLAQAMVPQGVGYDSAGDRVIISSYAGGSVPSVLSATGLSDGTLSGEYFLYQADGSAFTSHVGGVAVTDSGVYVSAKADSDGRYSVAFFPREALFRAGSWEVRAEETVPLPVSPSFLSCSDGMLWVGNFYHPDGDYGLSSGIPYTTATADGDYGCYILGYALSDGRLPAFDGDFPIPDVVLCAPNKIQGVAVTGGQVLLSQSYGRKNNSALLSYALDPEEAGDSSISLGGREVPMFLLDSARQSGSLTAMPMTEGLCPLPDGSILVLFESGAIKYSDGSFRTDQVWQLSPGE